MKQILHIFRSTLPKNTFWATPNHIFSLVSQNFQEFTYFQVDYIAPISKVDVSFEPITKILTFNIYFPNMAIPIKIIGYSMPGSKNDRVKYYIID